MSFFVIDVVVVDVVVDVVVVAAAAVAVAGAPEMQVNEMHAFYDKHRSVLFPNVTKTHSSVKYEVI